MRKMGMKSLAALGLSACLLVGSALPGFAVGEGGAHEHEWTIIEHWTTNCVDEEYTIRDADGTTHTVTICPTCGEEDDKPLLTKVDGCFSNYSDLYVFQGTLKNGMNVMTVAFYYPEHDVTVLCEECGEIREKTHTDDSMPENPMTATIEMPKSVVEGYTLMRINADGTETPLEVSVGERKASFTLTLDSGACMIHLVKN